jgi:hypothetical protein
MPLNPTTPINECGLSTRAVWALESDGINTAGAAVERSNQELMRIPNFGRKALAEIMALRVLMKTTLRFDRAQVIAFLDAVIGFRSVGVAQDESIEIPCAPEARAFMTAAIPGTGVPYGGYAVLTFLPSPGPAISEFFRRMADSIDANAKKPD